MRDHAHAIARRRTTVEGVRLHYRVAGRGRGGAGAPVVCLPAPGGSAASLEPLLEQLSHHRLAFALDLPGQGRSGNPPFGRRDPAWWLLAWLNRLGFEHVHLVVADGAVGVATDAVRRSPRTISSIALLAPPALTRTAATRRLGVAVGEGVRGIREAGSLVRGAARLRGGSAAAFREAMHPRDLRGELESLVLPLLVLRGAEDPVVTKDDAARLARLAHGTFIDLPAAGRSAHRTQPAAIAASMQRWWDAVEHDDDSTSSEAARGRTQENRRP